MGSERKYRYPGINFFTKEDEDIFCGRADDVQKLFNRVMLNNTMVLHGESGTGKSSLVQAGLIPSLEKRNEYLLSQHKSQYLPVTIRLDSILEVSGREAGKMAGESDILVRQVLDNVNQQSRYKAKELPYISRKDNSFWYTAKLFEKNNYTLLLILDQFEELQGYAYKEAEVFAQKLSELFVSTMPEAIYKEYDTVTADLVNEKEMTEDARKEYNQNIKFLEQPLNVRILFVVREDKLGTMSLLSDYFPDILKNDFFLLPLDINGARKAIAEPAQKEGNFISGRFIIDDGAVDHLLQTLVDQNTKLYDPIQLQIVCSSIEKKIAPNKVLIKKEDIPLIKDIISDFYKDTWKGVKTGFKLSDKEYEKKRKAIIDELVVSDKRNLVLKNLLISDGNEQDENIIKYLVREGLLRKIPSGKDTFYQLSHDRLINPLTEDLKDLKTKENVQKEIQEQKARTKRRTMQGLIIASSLLIIATLFAVYFAAKASRSAKEARLSEKKADQEKYMLISTALKRGGNPTLSYIIARDWLQKNPQSDTMAKYLRGFDSSNYVYLTGIYPTLSEVIYASIERGNLLTINEANNQSVWDIEKSIMIEKKKPNDSIRVKRIRTMKGQWFDVIETDDSVIIKDDTGGEIARIKEDYALGPENIAISPDARYLLVENEIFRMGTSKPIAPLPPYELRDKKNKLLKTYEQTASLFLNNNRVAAGYENGKILVYEIYENIKQKIKTVDTLYSPDYDLYPDNNRINVLTADTGKQYLLAANSQNGIDVYNLTRSKGPGAGEEIDSKKNNHYVTTLTGHTGLVKCMAFSSDNRLLLSGSSDYTAILWNIVEMKRVATLKGPGAAEVKYVYFLTGDKDIITVSENNSEDNKVYLWKRERPSALYEKNQLYRFSPFNYYGWLLNENKDGRPRDTTVTKELYSTTLNYILNFPSGNEYPDEENYTNSLIIASAEIKTMYNKLTNRKDYPDSIADFNRTLLDEYYTNFLPEIDRDLIKSKRQVAEWKIILSDTNGVASPSSLITRFILIASKYVDRKSNYPDGLRFIKFYTDSVLQPLTIQYGSNPDLIRLKRSINVYWLKYYLYTGKANEAMNMANELSNTISRTTNYKLYLVAAYLVSGKYSEAAILYNDIKETRGWKTYSERIFRSLLKRLKEKNIAVSNIDRFYNEFKLESADKQD